MNRFWRSVALALALAAALVAGEPAKTPAQKRELREYVRSGRYDAQIAAVVTEAELQLTKRMHQQLAGDRFAIVLDLDETLLRNWAAIDAEDFVYVPAIWDKWVTDAHAPAIEPVRRLFQRARQLGCEVIILTARRERERAATALNLGRIACHDGRVIYMPDDYVGTVEAFKTAERKRLVAEGRTIILNLGDQDSDLAGGYAEKTFKLPNPFYVTP